MPRTSADIQARHERILALLDRISARMDPNLSREQIDDLFYDEHGAPRGCDSFRSDTASDRVEWHKEVRRTLAIMHAAVTDDDRTFDDDAWLYDEQGLPH